MKGVWWIVVIVASLVCPLVIHKTKTLRFNTVTFDFETATPLVIENTNALRYNPVTFNFEGATEASYSEFVNSLRNEVQSKVVQGLPVTAKTVPDSKRYILVDLEIDSQKFITLAIDVIDMYLVGYRDKYNGKDRANFLKDAPKVARDNLFKEATKAKQVRNTTFNGTYTDLERFAKSGREKIELGIRKLQKAIDEFYGKSDEEKKSQANSEAKFFIISIQMVSEAARFQYILNKVLEGGIYGSYKPDFKATSLETSWDKISKAIQNADAASGEFRPPTSSVSLQDEKGKAWIVKKVSDIKSDMGLLKGKAS
ncbi:unnamed protein product [Dovyalis caffra]|uniref:rRNA N-glycosylase n=1 Tax=Dovyalis caffra TaxID=77055 RepID=A0AAV1SM37_9ROSI|nr:unnamed protein product [Dovyalis caffra]